MYEAKMLSPVQQVCAASGGERMSNGEETARREQRGEGSEACAC